MSSTEKNKNFLIIRFSSFGDVLLTSHVPKAIKVKHPDSKIFFLVKENFGVMLKDHPDIDHIVFFRSLNEAVKELKSIVFDIIFDLQHNYRSIILSYRLKKKQTFHYNKQSIKRYFYVNFKVGTYNLPYKSVIERYADTLKDASIPYEKKLIYSATTDITGLNLPTNYICIAAGSAHYTKQWPLDYQVEFIKKIKELTNYAIVLIGGKKERQISDIIQKSVENCYNLVGELDFVQSSECIKKAAYVVCNDSSVMHLARVHNKKGLVFFGSTTKRFGFYPDNENLEVLENNSLHCRPCSHIGRKSCPKKHFKCMMDIKPEMALKIIEKRLDKL
jgi:ADP-heptose:LPS heptosyltransferase